MNSEKLSLVMLTVIFANLQCIATSSRQPEVDKIVHRQTRQISSEEKKYDQCSHPFHSFLCNPAPKPRTFNPVGSASFNVKQIVKPSPPVVASPSFDVKTIASPPTKVKPIPDSNFLQKLTTPRPTQKTIEEPSPVNCQQHDVFVQAPVTSKSTTTTPKTIVIVGESSFSRESRLPPQPYLPPLDSPSPAPTFLDPQKLAPPLAPLPSKPKTPIFEGQAANTPQSIVPKDNEVENCKHAFHSFLCSSPPRSRVLSNTPKLTANSPLRGENTILDPQKVLVPQPFPSQQNIFTITTKAAAPSISTTTSRPTTTTPVRIFTSTIPLPPARYFAEAAQTAPQVLTPEKPKQPGICNDAFHSFLCQPINTSKRKQKFGEKVPSQNNASPSPLNPLIGDSSFIKPSKVFPNFNDPYSTNKTRTYSTVITPTTTSEPFFIPQTANTTQEPYYFCNTTSTTVRPLTTTTRTYTPFPIKTDPSVYHRSSLLPTTTTSRKPFTFAPFTTTSSPIKADSSFNDPVRYPIQLTTTQRTTVKTPDPPARNVAAAQTPDIAIVRPDHDHGHGHGHDHHHHHGIDICKDPFHSFLCIPVEPSKRRRPTGELPTRFKNPVPPNLTGASSFNNPTKVLPEVRKTPSTTVKTTPTSTSRPHFASRQPDIQPQPAQIEQIRQSPPTSKPKEIAKNIPCKHPSHSTESQPSRDPTFKGESTFVNPSKILPSSPFSARSSENRGYEYPKPEPALPTTTRHPGYVYNKPANQLQYPKAPLTGASTIDQPSIKVPPNNFASSNNKAGYTYEKPSNPLELPTTTRRPNDNVFGQSSNDKGNSQGYNYPKPLPNQQFPTPRPLIAPSSFNSNAVKTPFSSSIFGANTNIISKQTTQSGSPIGESANNRETFQGYSYPKTQENILTTRKPDNFQGYNYRKPENEFQSPSNDRIPTISNPDIVPRPFRKSTIESPPCEHSSRQVTRSAKSPPTPSEFVRGPTAAASVLAASNDLPDKCNHPFLGYVCKRSSDNQSHNLK